MDQKLFGSAMVKFLSGVLLMGLLLFLPAGTFAYWQGWLLMGILFVPMFVAGLVMMAKSPELLRRRLNAREEQTEQKQVIDENARKAVEYQKAINRADVETLVDEWKTSGVMTVTTAEEMDLTGLKEASESVYDWYEKQLVSEKGMTEQEAKHFVDVFRAAQT